MDDTAPAARICRTCAYAEMRIPAYTPGRDPYADVKFLRQRRRLDRPVPSPTRSPHAASAR